MPIWIFFGYTYASSYMTPNPLTKEPLGQAHRRACLSFCTAAKAPTLADHARSLWGDAAADSP